MSYDFDKLSVHTTCPPVQDSLLLTFMVNLHLKRCHDGRRSKSEEWKASVGSQAKRQPQRGRWIGWEARVKKSGSEKTISCCWVGLLLLFHLHLLLLLCRTPGACPPWHVFVKPFAPLALWHGALPTCLPHLREEGRGSSLFLSLFHREWIYVSLFHSEYSCVNFFLFRVYPQYWWELATKDTCWCLKLSILIFVWLSTSLFIIICFATTTHALWGNYWKYWKLH